MAEPLPSASASASATNPPTDPEDPPKPTNAEDRKAAAALDSLNANAMSQENGESSGTKQVTAADQEALASAMARLEKVAGGSGEGKKAGKGGSGGVGVGVKNAKEGERDAEVKKKVKIEAGDVHFLVSELDVPKAKATELLRVHDGALDAVVKSLVLPGIKA